MIDAGNTALRTTWTPSHSISPGRGEHMNIHEGGQVELFQKPTYQRSMPSPVGSVFAPRSSLVDPCVRAPRQLFTGIDSPYIYIPRDDGPPLFSIQASSDQRQSVASDAVEDLQSISRRAYAYIVQGGTLHRDEPLRV